MYIYMILRHIMYMMCHVMSRDCDELVTPCCVTCDASYDTCMLLQLLFHGTRIVIFQENMQAIRQDFEAQIIMYSGND